MNVLKNGAADLSEVSIVTPSDADTVVAYSRTKPDPSPVRPDALDRMLLDAFGEFEVIGYEFDSGVLRVMVAVTLEQGELDKAISRFFVQLASQAG